MFNFREVYMRALDALFPRSSIEHFSEEQFTSEIHDAVEPRHHTDDRLWSAFTYNHPSVRGAIWQLKYNGSRHAAKLLAAALDPHLSEHIADTLIIMGDGQIHITAIPGDTRRVRERGVDHVKLLAEALPAEIFAYTPLLGRTKHTKQQTQQITRQDRWNNVHRSMYVIDPSVPTNTPIIVLDDVITTGATMQEAFRALEEAGYTNYIGISVAH